MRESTNEQILRDIDDCEREIQRNVRFTAMASALKAVAGAWETAEGCHICYSYSHGLYLCARHAAVITRACAVAAALFKEQPAVIAEPDTEEDRERDREEYEAFGLFDHQG